MSSSINELFSPYLLYFTQKLHINMYKTVICRYSIVECMTQTLKKKVEKKYQQNTKESPNLPFHF